MIIETPPRRPRFSRNYYRRQRRGNPITTALGIGALLYFGWHVVQMGTAPIRPDLAAPTGDFNRGVDFHGAADSRDVRLPGSSRVSGASESRVSFLAGDRGGTHE